MGIYIEGVEIPAEGMLCIGIFPDGRVVGQCYCTIKQAKAVPVPAHGRLIDGDALERLGFHTAVAYTGIMPYEYIAMSISHAPTIIPASEEEMK